MRKFYASNAVKTVLVIAAVFSTSRLLIGCGATRPAQVGGGGNQGNLTGMGSVEGFVFTAGGNPSQVLRGPASGKEALLRKQDPNTQNGITLGRTGMPPAGLAGLNGATVSILNTNLNTTTDSTGHFLLQNVPAGSGRLRVGTSAGRMGDFPITVIGDARVTVGTPPVSRQQAVDMVQQSLTGSSLNEALIIGPQNPLPANVVVGQGMGNAHGQDDTSIANTLSSSQWFLYVDRFSDGMFRHPVQYVFVDSETGAMTTRNAASWPVLNGIGFYRNHDVNLQSDELIHAPTAIASDQPTLEGLAQARLRDHQKVSLSHVPNCPNPQSYAILIQGSDERAMDNSFSDLQTLLTGSLGVPAANLVTVRPPSMDPLAEITMKLNGLKSRITRCDTLYFFMVSHGFSGGVSFITRSATPVIGQVQIPFTNLRLGSDATTVAVTADSIASLLADVLACHIFVYIDACESGSFIPPIMAVLDPKPGLVAAVMASASPGKFGRFVRSELELQRPGLVFTTYFTDNLTTLRQTMPNADAFQGFDAALDNIRRNSGFPTVRGLYAGRALDAMPDSWVRMMRPGETCGGGGTSLMVSPTSISSSHTVGVSPCPQNLGTLAIQNPRQETVMYTATSSHTAIQLSNSTGSIPPEGTGAVFVSFNCSVFPPVSATITIMISAPSGNQTLTVPVSLASGAGAGF